MTSEPHEPREPTTRSAAIAPDWATAATEARRQRDAAAKEMRAEQTAAVEAGPRLVAERILPDQENLMQILNARALKCTVVLDPAEVAQLVAPDGKPRVVIDIRLPDRRLSADLNAKSVRRTIATIGEHGPDGVTVVVQGKLVGDTISEAGIMAQPKGAPKDKPEPQATPATQPTPQTVVATADARFPLSQATQDAVQPAERHPGPPGGSWLAAAAAAAAAAQATASRPGDAWLDAATDVRRQRDARARRSIDQQHAQQQRDEWAPERVGRVYAGTTRPLRG
jgi:hypothetical protein